MDHLLEYENFLNESIKISSDLSKDKEFIDFVRNEWGDEYTNFSKEEINDGYCILVFNFLKSKYKNAIPYTVGNPMNYHVFAKIGDKYYDGIDYQGVGNYKNLDWLKDKPQRIINSLQKGIIFNN